MFFIGGRERTEEFCHFFHTLHLEGSTRRLHFWSWKLELWAYQMDHTLPNQVFIFIGAKGEVTTSHACFWAWGWATKYQGSAVIPLQAKCRATKRGIEFSFSWYLDDLGGRPTSCWLSIHPTSHVQLQISCMVANFEERKLFCTTSCRVCLACFCFRLE